jgi:UDP-N-acetylmuramoylalanine--D-glutamate ligase
VITSSAFSGKSYAVYGLARSGVATVEALLASGANVMAWDEKAEAREMLLPGTRRATRRSSVEGAPCGSQAPLHQAAPGPPPRPGEDHLRIADPLATALTGFSGIVVSPGVPINRHPIAARARQAKMPLIGDIELFAQARASLPPHKVVGITGTNGKSTTTALIHHILETAGIPTMMGGNIGLPILAQDPLPEGGVYVLELSSYQIDLTQSLDCDVAALLNVTPDHLDRYEDMDDYAASKTRLFTLQSPEHAAVITTDDQYTRAISLSGQIVARRIGVNSVLIKDSSRWPALQGAHNAQNLAVAVATCFELGVPDATIFNALETFPGLPHRMERIRERRGVLYVNDSKATNPEAAAPALAAFPAVHWIVGGLPKGDDLGPCARHLDHVRAAYTIGEAGPMFAKLLRSAVPVTECGVLGAAVDAAAGAAKAGEVVLLSPACASFDQFRDYEARGDEFRACVEALA